MYLKQIRVNGFKTFVSKINIELERGIIGTGGNQTLEVKVNLVK